ncbi:MAG: response regulator, partial [Leptospiraceae bacterium]|nr:response regulator [Leptospiraceae bacterium]
LSVILMLLFLVLAVERAQHGYQPALWLLISQILTLTCTVLFFLLGHGLIEANLLTLNSIRVATIQQIILFSLALTHRLRFTERHYHTKLEDKVNERTNELAELIQVYEVQNDLLLRTTQDLQENEEKFRALAHSAYDAVLLLTNNGLISFWNRAAQQMFGYTADLARNQKFLQLLIPEEDQSELKNRFQQYFRADGIDRTGETFESRANRKDGSIITIEISVSSIQLKSDWLIVAVIRDISKRKREERQLLEAKKTAEEATRAKSEFLATMSHEIRTPLNAVLGFTDLLLKSNPPESQLQYLQIIQSRGIDLLTILNDTLDLSKIEAGKMDMAPMAVNLKELVDDVIRTMLPQAVARNLSLFCEMDADVPEHVLLDPVRVRQILMNLINNALKFTETGSISVHVDVGHPEMLPDAKNLSEDICILHIAVSDTGIGISPAKQSIIFDAFAQEDSSTTRRFGGTGLGLSICSSLIQLMRGRIWLQSEPGKGSTFELAVPVDMAATRDALTGLAATGGQNDATDEPVGLRILVVEDEPVNRLLAGKILENMGHHVSEASDGHTALQMIQHNVFDLILMDMEMPGIDGYETSVRIRMLELEKNLARQPILAVTAHSSQETRERCLRAGMDGYLSKPIHIDALRTQMRATLERGQTVHN